ncbi:MAG: hypothetical protein BMS9Abin07_1978 [Acidimicrobiia bacterium]|nr:MAG: hypothetical protein BMS9Abin07_1978 [Acidimicrobiia bacterium]
MLSVVSPLYRSRTQVGDFLGRLRSTLDDLDTAWEIVLVDDSCPDESGLAAARSATADSRTRVVRLDRNVGQVAAVIIGLGCARGDVVVVLDADLQDQPEDVAVLFNRLAADGSDAVAAGRSGRYTTRGRRATAGLFRTVRSALTLGRVPRDAGLFLAARREVIDRVLALDDPEVHLVSGLARVGATMSSVPVERQPRPVGSSGYSWPKRISIAAGALAAVTPLYPILRRQRRRSWSPPALGWLTEERLP